jgi:hypothetical protein
MSSVLRYITRPSAWCLCAAILTPFAAQAHQLYVLTSGNSIATVNEATPGTPGPAIPVTGVAAGQNLVAIDVRPINNRLYGLATNGAGAVELYLIDMQGAAPYANSLGSPGQLVNASGTALPITGTSFGMDFNPANDRLRVVTSSGMNFRLNPNTGLFVDGDSGSAGTNPDGAANTGSSTFDDVAYSNPRADTTTSTAYAIDSVTQKLFVMSPANSGTLLLGQTIRLNGNALNFSNDTGLDIALDGPTSEPNQATSGKLYAALTVGGISGLYRIDPADGAATALGILGGLSVKDIAVADTPSASLALNANGMTVMRFLTRLPGAGLSTAINGLVGSDRLVGMDLRPATGQYMALGVNASQNSATLYLLDPYTGALSVVGTPSGISFVGNDGVTAVDLADGTYGVTFNPMTDRLRVVASNGLNFRCNPLNGLAVDGNFGSVSTFSGVNPDGNIIGSTSTGLDGAAYTGNQYSGTPGTVPATLYTLDSAGHHLAIQNPPNSGTQTLPLGITRLGAPLLFANTTGFDVPPGWAGSADNVPVTAIAYAALTVGGSTHLYTIALSTGAAADEGAIGSGTDPMVGLVVGRDDELIFRNDFQ